MRTWILMSVVAAAVAVGAFSRGPDVQKMADGAIDSVALDDQVDAHFDAGSNVVRLTGTVDSDGDRARALEVVTAAVGAHAQIANEVVVRGLQADAADDLDEGIEERFKTLMDAEPALKDGEVDIRVKNGVVTLTGETATAAQSTRIEDIATSIPGVTQVVNSLTVDRRDTPRTKRQ